MFYLERVFYKLPKKEEEFKPFLDVFSTENLKKLKKDIFGFQYSDYVFWEDFEKEERIILLAEAGYGKTTEFKYRYKKDKEENQYTFFLNIDLLSDNSNVYDLLSDNDRELYDNWIRDNEEAIFYIDALDEVLAENPELLKNLIKIFKTQRNKKFKLRISSRPKFVTSKDINIIERHLGEFFKIKLLPFLDEDIKNFAKNRNIIEYEQFYTRLLEQGILNYAKIPLLLLAIVDEYKNGKVLPNNKIGILEILIKLAVKESENFKHRIQIIEENKIINEFLPRIALFNFFSKNNILCEEGKEHSYKNLPLDRITYGEKKEVLNEILDTLVFEKISVTCFKFKFKTFEEFLVATYINKALNEKILTLNKLNSIISYDNKIFTPYLDFAGLLATLNKQFRNYWFTKEERILHRIDLRYMSDGDRRRIFEEFKNQYQNIGYYETEILNSDPAFYKNFEPWRDYLKELLAYGNRLLKEFAIRTIWFNSFKEYVFDLLEIIKNKNFDEHVRTVAVLAIGEIGSIEEKKELLKIINKNLPDELLGAFLKVLYPEIISTTELVKYLKHNKTDTFDLYWRFLNILRDTLNIEEKIFILENLFREAFEEDDLKSHLSKFLKDILEDVIKNTNKPENLETIFFSLKNIYENENKYEAHEYLRKIIEKNPEFTIYFLEKILLYKSEQEIKYILFDFTYPINNEIVIKSILNRIKESSQLRKKLYEILLNQLYEENKIKFLKNLYELKNEFKELKSIWGKFSSINLNDKEKVNQLKEFYEQEQKWEKEKIDRELKLKKDKEQLLKELTKIAEYVRDQQKDFNEIYKFLIEFLYLKKGLFIPIHRELNENENGIIKYLGNEYYSLYLSRLEQFINWNNLSKQINFRNRYVLEIVEDAWNEFQKDNIKLYNSEELIYTLARIFTYLHPLVGKQHYLEELVKKFGNKYRNQILKGFREELNESLKEDKFLSLHFENKEIYRFFENTFIDFVKNNFSQLKFNDLKYSVIPFLIRIQKLEEIRNNIISAINDFLRQQNFEDKLYLYISVLFYIDFEIAWEKFNEIKSKLFKENEKKFIEITFANFYELYDYHKEIISYLENKSPDWELRLIDLLYFYFPKDTHPKSIVSSIHRITELKYFLKNRIIQIPDKRIKEILIEKISHAESSLLLIWQYLLKSWIDNYYLKVPHLTYEEIENVFIHGYHLLRNEEDLFNLAKDLLDEIILQIEDPEVGIVKLLYNKDGTIKHEKQLQLLISNLLKEKTKNLKVIPKREIELRNETKIDISIISTDINISLPIEIKYSKNNDKNRGLFTGIFNELLENYMKNSNYGVYFIGIVWENEEINVVSKSRDAILKRFNKYPSLKEEINKFFIENSIEEIKELPDLQNLFLIIKKWIEKNFNKHIAIKFLNLK